MATVIASFSSTVRRMCYAHQRSTPRAYVDVTARTRWRFGTEADLEPDIRTFCHWWPVGSMFAERADIVLVCADGMGLPLVVSKP